MKNCIKYYLLCAIALSSLNSSAHQDRIDSLKKNVQASKNDTSKIKTLNELSWALENRGEDSSAMRYAKRALFISDSLLPIAPDKKTIYTLNKVKAKSLGNLGVIYADLGNYPMALENMQEAIRIKKVILDLSEKEGSKNEIRKNKQTIASSFNNIAIIYENQGNYAEALKRDFESLKLSESIRDSAGIGRSHNSIGLVYSDQRNYTDALINYFASLKIKERLGDSQGVAGSYVNIGEIYKEQYDFNTALKYYSKATEIFKNIGDPFGLETALANRGTIYMDLGNFPESFKNHFAALEIQEKIGDQNGKAITYLNLADLNFRMKNRSAKKYLLQALSISKNIGSKRDLKDCYLLLSEVDSADHNFKESFADYKSYIIYRDSLFGEENTKRSVQVQMQYDFDKKSSADSIKNAEQVIQEQLKHEHEIKQQQLYTFGGGIGFLLMIIVAGVSFRAYRQKQKANEIISEQKLLVEEKQKEILDSIYYARRIQRSLLPTEKYIIRCLERLKR